VNGQWEMVAMATVPLKFIIDGSSLPMGGAKHPHKG